MRFQYKICYSKILGMAVAVASKVEFQYKICYSKIKGAKVWFAPKDDFNTKFVIAKLYFYLQNMMKL